MGGTREHTSTTGGARSAARLGAVQALYQLEQSEATDPRLTVEEFRRHRLGKEVDGDLYARPDSELFEDIVLGAVARGAELNDRLAQALPAEWPLERLDSVLRAILRAGAYEIAARPDIPTAVIINEYVDVAHAFDGGGEPALVNAVLDRLARELRS